MTTVVGEILWVVHPPLEKIGGFAPGYILSSELIENHRNMRAVLVWLKSGGSSVEKCSDLQMTLNTRAHSNSFRFSPLLVWRNLSHKNFDHVSVTARNVVTLLTTPSHAVLLDTGCNERQWCQRIGLDCWRGELLFINNRHNEYFCTAARIV